MKRSLAFVVGLGALVVACVKVPYTGRKAVNPIPDAVMVALSVQTYKDMLGDVKVIKQGSDAELLDGIGRRIAKVANQPDYDWEVSLIDEDTVNAWCLPGGKIGFYTGILPVLKNEAAVAFVMGHEVGHAVARHGGERMSQQLALFGGLAGLFVILEKETKLTTEQNAVVVGALGVGLELGVILPFSRMHESEADIIGTMYMANAGYPPAEAIEVWDRMGKGGGMELPAFLSTHPSDEKRQEVIREWLPKAKKRYERNKIDRDTTAVLWKKEGGNDGADGGRDGGGRDGGGKDGGGKDGGGRDDGTVGGQR